MIWDMAPIVAANGGSEAFKRDVLPRLNAISRKYGGGDLYLVLVQNWPHRAAFSEVGDAFTGYSYAGLTSETEVGANTHAPYSEMVDALPRYWRGMHASAKLPFMTSTQSGWDNTTRTLSGGGARLVRPGTSPELFERTLVEGRKQIKPELPFFLIEAWNEFGEGSYIEPTEQFGFRYLEAIRRTFVSNAPPHEWARPTEAQVKSYTSLTPAQITESLRPPVPLPPLPVPQWEIELAVNAPAAMQPATTRPAEVVRSFDFDTATLPMGVTATGALATKGTDSTTRFRNDQGAGLLSFEGDFGVIASDLFIEATLAYGDQPVWIAQFLYGIDGKTPAAEKARPVLWKVDGREHVYRLRFNPSHPWSGRLTSFQFIMPDWPGVEADIRSVRVMRYEAKSAQ
jgi:hypothetical protein